MNPLLQQVQESMDANVQKNAPELYEAYKRTVLAGKKILFNPKTHQNMELVKNPESRNDPVNTIAKGVAGLMNLMWLQSKKKMPVQVVIMAGVTLMAEVMDFAERSFGLQIEPQLVSQTTKAMMFLLFKHLGISEEQLSQAIKQGAADIQQHKQGGMLKGAQNG